MSTISYDPIATAREQADRIQADPEQYLYGALNRTLLDVPFLDRDRLLAGLGDFHRERMARVPDAAAFPESPAWVDAVFATDRELQRLTGLSDDDLALVRSLNDYLTFRGYCGARLKPVERCRVAYFPDTDRGAVHIKNVDDPLTHWRPDAPLPQTRPRQPEPPPHVILDGVGSGLHLDDEPSEIFPLPALTMLKHHCHSTPEALDFLQRYSPFVGGANWVVRDSERSVAAVEKTSRNHLEVFGPDRCGGHHVSGNVCRDATSPQGRYVAECRAEYRRRFNMPDDCADVRYWANCDLAESMLADLMRQRRVRFAEIVELFTTPWPRGLRKDGIALHPDATSAPEYTLITAISLLDEGTTIRYQRDAAGAYPASPEACVTIDT